MTEYTILIPAALPDNCYLLEALYWRAFGRPPLEHGALDAPSFRESLDDGYNYDDFGVVNFGGEELDEHECAYAGLPPDPRMKALLEGRSTRIDLEDSQTYWTEVYEWMPAFEAYLDEFKAEICLDLRRGKLSAAVCSHMLIGNKVLKFWIRLKIAGPCPSSLSRKVHG